jgi:3-oxoacyl-[acyl-carrier-protein] synthase-1
VNYSISSACATSNHCIGNAAEVIQLGKQDVIFAGGSEELDLDAVGALRRHGGHVVEVQRPPETASRAYDR